MISHDIHGYMAKKYLEKPPSIVGSNGPMRRSSAVDSNGSFSKRADTIGSLTCYAKDHGELVQLPSSDTIGQRYNPNSAFKEVKTDDVEQAQMDITMSRSAALSCIESARLSGKYF